MANLQKSLKECRKFGGRILLKSRSLGRVTVAVIRDSVGAVAVLYQPDA